MIQGEHAGALGVRLFPTSVSRCPTSPRERFSTRYSGWSATLSCLTARPVGLGKATPCSSFPGEQGLLHFGFELLDDDGSRNPRAADRRRHHLRSRSTPSTSRAGGQPGRAGVTDPDGTPSTPHPCNRTA